MPKKILILGGTTQARRLCQVLSGDQDYKVILSLAGATKHPYLPDVFTRIGGFGGVRPMAQWIEEHAIDKVVDATHPFAVMISDHARRACEACQRPLLRFERKPWVRQPGDRWIEVDSVEQAARTLRVSSPFRDHACQVFLTTGRKNISPFLHVTQHHYIVRSVDPPRGCEFLHNMTPLQERGPFREIDERKLFLRHKVDVLVTKNSGGDATYPKMEVARQLNVPVIIVRRPLGWSQGGVTADMNSVLDWLQK